VDCAQARGTIRPLHGGNSGPLNLGILWIYPNFTRTWHYRIRGCMTATAQSRCGGYACAVPDLKADPENPPATSFTRTDEYINPPLIPARKCFPPRKHRAHQIKYYCASTADYDAWIAACIGVIRHYNEGWANGIN